ncbi:MAG TPA: metallophosphoesterase [Polyangiales bacterium]
MLGIFVVASALWALLHAYVAVRLLAPSRLGRVGRTLCALLFALLALASPQVFTVDQLLREPYNQVFRWAAWIYIGGFTTLFALVVARDLIWLGLRLSERWRAPVLPTDPERRKFVLRTTGKVALGVTAAVTAWGARAARRVPEVVEVEVPIDGLPREFDGYHIVQLSDVHVGETIDKDFILPIIEQVTSLSPDLIALTGDLVDGSVDKLRADITPFAYLRAPDGVLCVTGNHEYYSGAEAWCARFRELGLTVLNNAHIALERAGKRLVVAGVTDLREGKHVPGHTSDPALALEGAPAHQTRILLAHQPRSIAVAKTLGYHLQLSGHTHGGQFFPWNLFIGLVQPLGSGLAKFDRTWLYVNRGTCYWGPPNRAGVPAEITSLRLRRA